jgi:hypothetical protein
MDTKAKLLKDLGFSDNFIKVIEKGSFDYNINSSEYIIPHFEAFNIKISDFTSLIIEKSVEPLNLNTFST